MIPDSLFSPPQSPFFFLLRVPFSSSSKSLFLPSPSPVPPLRVPLPTLQFIFLPLKVLSHPPRSPRSPGFVPSPPLPPRIRKQRNDPKPSRRSWLVWSVPKWNMILSLLVRPQSAVARLEHLVAVVPVSQLLPGLVANVFVHSNVKQAVIARPAADE